MAVFVENLSPVQEFVRQADEILSPLRGTSEFAPARAKLLTQARQEFPDHLREIEDAI